MCLLVNRIFSLDKSLFKSFAHFNGVVFSLLNYKISLCILNMSPVIRYDLQIFLYGQPHFVDFFFNFLDGIVYSTKFFNFDIV